MLYELVAIARFAGQDGVQDAREVARLVGKLVVRNRGVIRKVENWGIHPLPKIMHRNRQSHIIGSQFYMQFDSSTGVQREVMRELRKDVRILRSTLVKEGGDT
jgi:small subunit ribosomal protein S6